jgi:hypothetical protein
MSVSSLGLVETLRHPIESIRIFDQEPRTFKNLPKATWALLCGIAFGGSLIYGSSLVSMKDVLVSTGGALWVTASAGFAWCIFGPTLIFVTGKHPLILAHACLTTMAYGEMVLLAGALSNLLIAMTDIGNEYAGVWNFVIVALSNIVMLTMLTLQLKSIGVPHWKTILCWMLVLNGSGAVFFSMFKNPFLYSR